MKNVAIFGAGRIGRIHASNLAALNGVRLKYVSDPVAEAATALASALGAKVASVDEVFADPAIDAVVIASSTDTHSDLLSRAAGARKHIFCEKPIDLSLERVRAWADSAQLRPVLRSTRPRPDHGRRL